MKDPDMFLDGGDIYLRVPNDKDLEDSWYSWFNDQVVTKYQNKGIFPNTIDKQKEYFYSIKDSKTDIIFAIVEKKTGKHIGSVGLHKIDWIHRSAELGIVIGEKKFWGKGYGKMAWNLMTYYGLKILNLHRIYAHIFKDNVASIKCAEASGYEIEGEMRDMFFKHGRYHSVLLFSVLDDEFQKI